MRAAFRYLKAGYIIASLLLLGGVQRYARGGDPNSSAMCNLKCNGVPAATNNVQASSWDHRGS